MNGVTKKENSITYWRNAQRQEAESVWKIKKKLLNNNDNVHVQVQYVVNDMTCA